LGARKFWYTPSVIMSFVSLDIFISPVDYDVSFA
jgi:hypothetical protein